MSHRNPRDEKWFILDPGTLKLVEKPSFEEAMELYEGFNKPILMTNGLAEHWNASLERVAEYQRRKTASIPETVEEELKLCPFCGGKTMSVLHCREGHSDHHEPWIACRSCRATVHLRHWNCRAESQDQVKKSLVELIESLPDQVMIAQREEIEELKERAAKLGESYDQQMAQSMESMQKLIRENNQFKEREAKLVEALRYIASYRSGGVLINKDACDMHNMVMVAREALNLDVEKGKL